jgi:hypothetical protein
LAAATAVNRVAMHVHRLQCSAVRSTRYTRNRLAAATAVNRVAMHVHRLPRNACPSLARNACPSLQSRVITRDPLKVPCLTEGCWATFPELSGRHLAHTLSLIRDHPASHPLPRISDLAPADQLRAEDDNIRRCFAFAREGLSR